MKSKRETVSACPQFVMPLVFATLLSLGTTVSAQAQVSNEQTNGHYAYAYVELSGPTACTSLYVQLYAVAVMSKPVGANAQTVTTVDSSYASYDRCTDTWLSSANGSAQFPGMSGLRVQPTLSGAQLNTALVIADFETQALVPETINVSWTGFGDIIDQKQVTHYAQPDYFSNDRFMRKFREATPSGTITFGSLSYNLSDATYATGYVGTINAGRVATPPPQ